MEIDKLKNNKFLNQMKKKFSFIIYVFDLKQNSLNQYILCNCVERTFLNKKKATN